MPRFRLPVAVHLGEGVALPRGHSPGKHTPVGGASCANCRFGDRGHCYEPNFVRWNGSTQIPGEMRSYVSDWWQPRTR